jgi:hypothetical protein
MLCVVAPVFQLKLTLVEDAAAFRATLLVPGRQVIPMLELDVTETVGATLFPVTVIVAVPEQPVTEFVTLTT